MTREIDALVTEAMGWTEIHEHLLWSFESDLDFGKGQIIGRDSNRKWRVLPPLSSSIAAAWQVVEWMNKHKLHVQVEAYSNYNEDGTIRSPGASVEIYSDKGHPSYWYDVADADADTAPEAICLAFLKATGVELGSDE